MKKLFISLLLMILALPLLAAETHRIIIDQDSGADDAFAMMLCAKSPIFR